MKTRAHKLASYFTTWMLLALSLIYGYAVVQSGGVVRVEWERSIVALGVLLLIYFQWTKKSDSAPSAEWWLWLPPVLLLSFAIFQLIPIPAEWLKTISPMRAKLLASLNHVLPEPAYAPITVFPSGSLEQVLRLAAYFVVFVLTRELAWKTRHRRWRMVAPIVTIAAAEAALGLLQYDPLTGSYARGTYANQNHFAGLLEMSLPFAILYPIAALRKPRSGSLWESVLPSVCIAAAALILTGVILSNSRMAFVAALVSSMVAGTLIPVAARTSRSRSAAVVILFMILGATSFIYLAPDRLIGRFSQVVGSEDVPPDVRIHLWRDARRLAADYPAVGTGMGTFVQAFVRYKTLEPQIAIDSVHNDYLQLLIELGKIGFAWAALAMGCLLFAAGRAIYRNVDPNVRYLAIGCLSALIAILIHSATDFNLYIPANGMLLAWIAGIIAGLSFTAPKVIAESSRPGDRTQAS